MLTPWQCSESVVSGRQAGSYWDTGAVRLSRASQQSGHCLTGADTGAGWVTVMSQDSSLHHHSTPSYCFSLPSLHCRTPVLYDSRRVWLTQPCNFMFCSTCLARLVVRLTHLQRITRVQSRGKIKAIYHRSQQPCNVTHFIDLIKGPLGSASG